MNLNTDREVTDRTDPKDALDDVREGEDFDDESSSAKGSELFKGR